MVDEALVSYLEQAFPEPVRNTTNANGLLELGHGPGDLALGNDETALGEQPANTVLPQRLRTLLSYRRTGHDFSATETLQLISAIEQLRVLDPACGSGAFPMGMLQKLVHVLRKLDPNNALWKAQNRAPLEEQLASAKKVKDPTLRDEQTTAAKASLSKFDEDFADPEYADYARKLYLIEKCLYGVDIQPIAVQIAKLRFFISLVVEQKLGTTHQRLTPLPNLETKIVAANTLIPIPRSGPQQPLPTNPDFAEKQAERREANASHFAAKRFADKRKRKARILKLRDELASLLKAELMLAPDDAERMTHWDPFDQNIHAGFFDPEWMYGFQQGFDIVIGNPPYVRQEAFKDEKASLKPHYPHSYSGTADLYVYFYERSFQLLKPGGCLSFITSNKWFRSRYGQDLRQYMATHTELRQIIDFGDEDVFDALAYPTIVIATLRGKPVAADKAQNNVLVLNWDGENDAHQVIDFPNVFAREGFFVPQNALKIGGWQLEPPTQRILLERLRKAGKPLGDYCGDRFYYGIKTGLNEAFVLTGEQRKSLIAEDPASEEMIKPYVRGRDVKRWKVGSQDLWLIFVPWHFPLQDESNSGGPSTQAEKEFKRRYPAIYRHLSAYKTELSLRNSAETGIRYEWYALQRWASGYWREFETTKIVYPDIYLHQSFAWDSGKNYLANTCYFIPTTEKWLMGLLNSTTVEWFYEQIAARIQGGYLRAFSNKMQSIPIPTSTLKQQRIIESLVVAVEDEIQTREYERLINGLVYELFFQADLQAKNIRLFDACAAAGVNEGMDAKAVASTIFKNDHPIYAMLFDLQALDVVRTIEGIA
jgi:hypothetical protein